MPNFSPFKKKKTKSKVSKKDLHQEEEAKDPAQFQENVAQSKSFVLKDSDAAAIQALSGKQENVIITNLNNKVGHLIRNSQKLAMYHLGREKEKLKDAYNSIGSISSADERDMSLLFSGDHIYQFQAIHMVKKLT